MTGQEDVKPHLPIAEAIVNSVTGGVAALLVLHNPELAVYAGGLTPWASVAIAGLARHRRNVDLAAESGAEANGITVEVLASASIGDPFKEQLSFAAMDAAARSAYDTKIRALGRSWAAGVLTEDEGRIAQESQFLRTMAGLELPHIRVLELIEAPEDGDPVPAQGGAELNTPSALSEFLPEYGEMIAQFHGVLVSEGLIELVAQAGRAYRPRTVYQITGPGRNVLRRLKDAAEGNVPDE